MDTPQDFELMEEIFDALYEEEVVIPLKRVVNLVDENPELKEINSAVQQKSPSPVRFCER